MHNERAKTRPMNISFWNKLRYQMSLRDPWSKDGGRGSIFDHSSLSATIIQANVWNCWLYILQGWIWAHNNPCTSFGMVHLSKDCSVYRKACFCLPRRRLPALETPAPLEIGLQWMDSAHAQRCVLQASSRCRYCQFMLHHIRDCSQSLTAESLTNRLQQQTPASPGPHKELRVMLEFSSQNRIWTHKRSWRIFQQWLINSILYSTKSMQCLRRVLLTKNVPL